MTRALGLVTAGLGLVVLAAPTARAGGHYGSFGFQMGLYHYPPPGGYAPAAGGSHHRAYSAPAYGYAPAAGYAPMMMMAPAAGCSGAGYAPMMAPAGCSGSGYSAPAYGYAAPAYGYGYAAPGYGYAAPQAQAGFLPYGAGGGILDALRALKEIRDTFDDFRGGSKDRGDSATKDEVTKLRSEVESLRRDLTTLKVPENLDLRLEQIRNDQEKLKLDLATLRRDFDNRPEKKK